MDECKDCGPDIKKGDVLKRRNGDLYFVGALRPSEGGIGLRLFNLSTGTVWYSKETFGDNFGDYEVVKCCYKVNK